MVFLLAYAPAFGKVTLVAAVATNAGAAFEEMAVVFERSSGVKVSLSAGATGLLARQLREGAPFDVFVSADMGTVETLARESLLTSSSVQSYARGTLCLWRAPEAGRRRQTIDDLVTSKADRLRIAIANPETAPFGAAAKQALQRLGVWDRLLPRIIIAENVTAAMNMARTGNVDAALVALSAVGDASEGAVVVPPALYAPIVQGMAVTYATRHRAEATAFCHFVRGAQGRAILLKYRFEVP